MGPIAAYPNSALFQHWVLPICDVDMATFRTMDHPNASCGEQSSCFVVLVLFDLCDYQDYLAGDNATPSSVPNAEVTQR